MKRLAYISCLLALLIAASTLCGCGLLGSADPTPEPTEEQVSIDTTDLAERTARPTAAPTPTPDPASAAKKLGEDYSASLNMLRVVKNHYYNVLDSALSEDDEMAPLLYQMLDYVYGDAVLEAFSGCFGGESEYAAYLGELGYKNVKIVSSPGEMSVNARYNGEDRVLTARFDPEKEAASLTVLSDNEIIRFYEWRAVEGGYAVQYAKALSDQNGPEQGGDDDAVSDVPTGIEAEFRGYRAYIFENATGYVCAGYYCIGELESIFDLPALDEAFIHRNMFSYYTFTLTQETVTVRSNGEEQVHTIGEISELDDEPDDEPDDGEEP